MSAKTDSRKPTTLFYSYSHVDEKHRNKLATHLALLKRQGFISEWYDRQILPGQEWEGQIDGNLATADIILLLVSADFIASDYCWSKEVAQALERHAAGTARVIPVIVRAVDWSGAPFAKLQALPKDAKPVTIWANRDAAWLDVAKGIRREIEAFANAGTAATAPATEAAPSASPTPRTSPPSADAAALPAARMRKRASAKALPPKVKGQPRRAVYDAENKIALPGTLVRSEGAPPTGDTAVDETYDGLGHTYAFFWDVFKRDSIDGKGMPLEATVHYSRDYNNAFWMGKQIILGDGDAKLFNRFTACIDVIAKEVVNGLVQSETELNYWGESGSVFQSIACVLGILVKQYALKQTPAKADWLLGAGLLAPEINGRAISSFANPGTAYDDPALGGKDRQISHMDNYANIKEDNGGIHINAGIGNRAFYLIATSLGGYAWEKAGRIWYETLQAKNLKSNTTFRDFARATAAAARSLFGARSDVAQTVKDGWAAVGVKAD